MAYIFIKRRRDPIMVSEKRAIELKKDWLENEKSTELIDLTEWSGQICQIVAIELERVIPKSEQIDFEAEHNTNVKKLLATPAKDRAKLLEEFKLMWFMRSGMTEKDPPRDILVKAEKLAFEYFTKETEAIRVPAELFEPLLFVRFGVKHNQRPSEALAEKMVVPEPHVEVGDVPF